MRSSSSFFNPRLRYESLPKSRYSASTYGGRLFSPNQLVAAKATPHGTYAELLFDKRWLARRATILARDHNRCVICFQENDLQVHHRQYHFIKSMEKFKAPWDYEDQLLITMCQKCHAKGHSKFKVPTIYI
jgi:hypothetical protein